jgi:Leu/Phe-tRNA-protein transferase
MHKLTREMLARRGFTPEKLGWLTPERNLVVSLEEALARCRRATRAEKQARYAAAHPEKMREIQAQCRAKK